MFQFFPYQEESVTLICLKDNILQELAKKLLQLSSENLNLTGCGPPPSGKRINYTHNSYVEAMTWCRVHTPSRDQRDNHTTRAPFSRDYSSVRKRGVRSFSSPLSALSRHRIDRCRLGEYIKAGSHNKHKKRKRKIVGRKIERERERERGEKGRQLSLQV